ncbi:MAG TPA: RNA degradosome polyphosphate kinase, partial [Ktedonobacteraceae bacterium]|nr:RNA degradosome polyphosphate kinase [Ktedonobacteraceae bacterium]
EHSRVYYFRNGGDEEILLGSADMMERNLDRRVETLFPIDYPALRVAIRDRLLTPALADTANARELLPDGSYKRIRPKTGEAPFDSQNWFISHPLVESDTNQQNHIIGALPSGS